MIKQITLITTLVALAILHTQPVVAQDSGCRPLYGGGATTQQVCGDKVMTPQAATQQPGTKPKATPTPIKFKSSIVTPTPNRAAPPGTTKGGLPILPSTPSNQTPSTGPEALGTLALIPAGALGYYLRKKG